MASSVRDWRSNTSLRPRQPKPRYLRARVDTGSRLQKVERVARPGGFAFEIGRVGGSRLEEGVVNLLRRPFIQSTVYLRSNRGVHGCLRAFSARSRNTILRF